METEARRDGPWLVARYAPVSLFSLKVSTATSTVGTTLVVPTPYAIKMALVDAAFRAGWPEGECATLLRDLVGVEVRIAPPEAVVTHTFYRVRQQNRDPDVNEPGPYRRSIAYREFACHQGEWRWAFGVDENESLAVRLRDLLPCVRYIGKRGGFIQFLGLEWSSGLGPEFTVPMREISGRPLPERCHVVPLDDFGPEANLEVLSSFSPAKARRDRHRVFVETLVPLGRVRTGPGFTEYRR